MGLDYVFYSNPLRIANELIEYTQKQRITEYSNTHITYSYRSYITHSPPIDKRFYYLNLKLLLQNVFSDSNKLTLFITKVFGYRPGNNSSTFNVSTHEGAGTFQALANKELTSPKANWASGL
ncbi:hypothetical protein H8356DRAFT_1435550 [Neocallimastix lanati (nom. inval.)]|nr:hypothetical protein H8356DRAFT_1435550 [Neocallimastix sp. JGI-2020a]